MFEGKHFFWLLLDHAVLACPCSQSTKAFSSLHGSPWPVRSFICCVESVTLRFSAHTEASLSRSPSQQQAWQRHQLSVSTWAPPTGTHAPRWGAWGCSGSHWSSWLGCFYTHCSAAQRGVCRTRSNAAPPILSNVLAAPCSHTISH